MPTHWSAIVGEDSLTVGEALKRSLEISNIFIHAQYKTNAPAFEIPSDYDIGESYVSTVEKSVTWKSW